MTGLLFYYSPNRSPIQDSIKAIIGAIEVKHHEEYLGLPSFVDRVKYSAIAHIKVRFWKKL